MIVTDRWAFQRVLVRRRSNIREFWLKWRARPAFVHWIIWNFGALGWPASRSSPGFSASEGWRARQDSNLRPPA
ncbi:MAG TPA: hypothetical protein VIK60_02315 [Vicinamibacterales bacterium]